MSADELPPGAYTTLGKTGRRVSRLGFGCYRVDDRVPAHREALHLALASGVTLIDTSTNYGDGHSETLVGQALKDTGERDAVTVVTKAGYVQGGNQREAVRRVREGRAWPEMTEYNRDCWHCISPEFLGDQLGASLKRLSMERVDVLLLHNPEYFLMDAEHRGVPVEEAREVFYDRVRRAFAHLEKEVAAGRIAAYGISSNTFVVPREKADAVDLGRILSFAGPSFGVIQLPMNPLELGAREPIHTDDGRSVLDVAREANLGVLVNRPLNAFGGRSLVRFAEASPPFEATAATPGDPFASLEALEDEFAERWAGRLNLGGGKDAPRPDELMRVSPLLRQMESGVRDLLTFNEVWDAHVAPRLDEVLVQLDELLAADPAFARWSESYRKSVAAAGAHAARALLAGEKQRTAPLVAKLSSAFGELPAGTVSQRTVRGLAGTPGVDVVLLGMRRTRYVRDAVAAFS